MKNMKGIAGVVLGFIAGVEVGIAVMAYGALWAVTSVKEEVKNYKPGYTSYRNKYDD